MNGNLLRNRWEQLPERVVRRLQAEQLTRYLSEVVVPFSAHYRKVFQDRGLNAQSIRTLEDLQRLPFPSKFDLLATPEQPQRFKNFILVPDEQVLRRRPATIVRALL